MGYADQRPKQVGGIEISSQVAASLCALHQLVVRSLDEAAGAFLEPRSASYDAIESGRNDVLCPDVVDTQQHPSP